MIVGRTSQVNAPSLVSSNEAPQDKGLGSDKLLSLALQSCETARGRGLSDTEPLKFQDMADNSKLILGPEVCFPDSSRCLRAGPQVYSERQESGIRSRRVGRLCKGILVGRRLGIALQAMVNIH